MGWYPNGGGFSTIDEAFVNRHNRILNNLIRDCGNAVGHAAGIQLYMSGENEIAHNRIERTTRYGISLKGCAYKDMPSVVYNEPVTKENFQKFCLVRDNVIAFNDIADVLRDSTDAGATEGFGTGKYNYVFNNAIHDFCDHVNGYATYGYMTDDDTDYYIYRNNLVYNWEGTDAYYRGGSPHAEYDNNYRFDTQEEAKELAPILGIDWEKIGLQPDFPFPVLKDSAARVCVCKQKAVEATEGDLLLKAYRWNSRKGMWTVNTFRAFVCADSQQTESWISFLRVDLGGGYSRMVAHVG